MSARDIIRQIEALPLSEQREVFEFVKRTAQPTTAGVRHASVEQVKEVAERVFDVNDELFRKLAQ